MRRLHRYLKSQRAMEWGLLLVPIISGLYLRAQTLKWHRLFAYDPYYFYRVATHIAQGGSIFDRDPMIVTISRRFIDDEPGLPLIWGYLSRITHVDTWTLGIYLPLIIFVLEVLMIYKLAKDGFNWRVGILSALFLAVVPGHIYRSHAGGIWKDTMGSLFMLMFLHAVILITRSEKLDRDKMIKYGAYLVSSLYLSAFTFDGFGAFPGAVSLYLLLLPLIHKPRKNEFLIAGLMIFPLVMVYLTLPTYTRESYALLPFLIASIVDLAALGLGHYLSKHEERNIIYGGVLFIVSVVLVYVVLFNPPNFLEDTSKIIWMFVLPGRYGKSAQSRPNTLTSLFNVWFSVSLFFALLGVIYIIKNIKERKNLLTIAWFVVLVLLGIATIRLTFLMSFSIAMTAALGMEFIYLKLAERLDPRKVVSLSIIILLVGIIPVSYEGKKYVSMSPIPPKYWLDGLEWMDNNIKEKIMFNWWDWGYWLEAYGVRTVGDNGAQTGISHSLYANLMLSNYSQLRYWFNRYSQLYITPVNSRKEIVSMDYLIVGFDLFQKFKALQEAYDRLVARYDYPASKVYFIVLPLKYMSPSYRIYENKDMTLLVENHNVVFRINNSFIKVKDIIYERTGDNKVVHLNTLGVIVYINGPYAVIFNEDSTNATLVQLFVYENQTNAQLIWENGFVKIYKPLQ